MYKLLIADDEKMERETIAWLTSKHELPVEIRTAEDGEEALRLLAEEPADILFTDIRMPFVDGLELSRRAKELYPDLKIIIYSAYGEFEYARNAMQLGVTDYLLKPLEVPAFLETLNRTIGQVAALKKERQHQMREALRELLYRQAPVVPVHLDSGEKYWQLALIQMREPVFDHYGQEAEAQITGLLREQDVYVNLNERQSVLFFADQAEPGEDRTSFRQSLLDRMTSAFQSECLLVFGRTAVPVTSIRTEFQRLEQVKEFGFFVEGSTVWADEGLIADTATGDEADETGPDANGPDVQAILNDFYSSIDSHNYAQLQEQIHLFVNVLRNQRAYPSLFVKCLFAEIQRRLSEKLGLAPERIMEAQETIMRMESINAIRQHLLAQIEELQERQQVKTNPDGGHKAVSEVLRTIQEKYGEDLSLEQLAQSVYMSPSYLSYLFKKKTGQSLSKYLTTYRLERAKELLDTTAMKVIDISQQVGYMNAWYFSHLFKSHYGMNPAQYRERK